MTCPAVPPDPAVAFLKLCGVCAVGWLATWGTAVVIVFVMMATAGNGLSRLNWMIPTYFGFMAVAILVATIVSAIAARVVGARWWAALGLITGALVVHLVTGAFAAFSTLVIFNR